MCNSGQVQWAWLISAPFGVSWSSLQTRVQTHPKAHPFTNLRTQLGCQPEQSPTASYGLWVPGGMVAVFQGRASPQKGHDFYDLASVLFTDSHKVPPKFKGRRNRLPLDGEQQGFRRACGMRDIVRTCNCHRRKMPSMQHVSAQQLVIVIIIRIIGKI